MSFSHNNRKILCVLGLGVVAFQSLAPAVDAASMQMPSGLTSALTHGTPVGAGIAEANRVFISQYPSRYNPYAFRRNNNCGPACLAMVLRLYGHGGNGGGGDSPQDEIISARVDMMGSMNDRLTGLRDVIRGARANDLTAYVARSINQIDGGLAGGAVAVVSGSPSTNASYGNRLPYTHAKAGHFILVTQRIGDQYIMCDPESPNGAYAIDRRELIGFLNYYEPGNTLRGAVMIASD